MKKLQLIKCVSDDGSIRLELRYIRGEVMRFYRGRKHFVKQTQCLVFFNDFLLTFDSIVKHKNDEDNDCLAIRLVTEKVLMQNQFMNNPIYKNKTPTENGGWWLRDFSEIIMNQIQKETAELSSQP